MLASQAIFIDGVRAILTGWEIPIFIVRIKLLAFGSAHYKILKCKRMPDVVRSIDGFYYLMGETQAK